MTAHDVPVTDDLAQDNAIPGAIDPLDLPQRGAGPLRAMKRFYQNYAKFSGRASRSEFWWVALVLALACTGLMVVGFVMSDASGYTDLQGQRHPGVGGTLFFLALGAIELGSILPFLALAVRRLHDAGFSGYRLFLYFAPFVGALALVIFLAFPSKQEGARFDVLRTVYPGMDSSGLHSASELYPGSAYPLQRQQAAGGSPAGPPSI